MSGYNLLYLTFYGGYSEGVHLFPFRTEKLSPSAQMVLHSVGEYVAAKFKLKAVSKETAFFFAL